MAKVGGSRGRVGAAATWPSRPDDRPAKIARVVVEHLAVEIERRERPDLRDRVVVIGGLPSERRPVFDMSVEGARLGIQRGMPLRQAHQLCPDAAFRPFDEPTYRRVYDGLLDLFERFSPTVEPDGQDGALLDASGLRLLFGEDDELAGRLVGAVGSELGLLAHVGIGPGKFVARVASRLAGRGPVIVGPTEARAFLARQPAWMLPLDATGRERLRRLGIRSIGQFADLPAEGLAVQIGSAGVAAHRLARGEDAEPLVARARPQLFVAERGFEPAIADLALFRGAAGRLIERLAGQLRGAGRSCRRLRLSLEIETGERWEGATDLREPSADTRELLRAVDRLIEQVELVGGVSGARVALEGIGPAVARQLDMFDVSSERRARLEGAVSRLRSRYGDHLRRLVLTDEQAWLPERRFVTREYGGRDSVAHDSAARDRVSRGAGRQDPGGKASR